MHIKAPVAELDRTSRRAPAASPSDTALIALCAQFNAIVDGVNAFGDLMNEVPGGHAHFDTCLATFRDLSAVVRSIALQVADTSATTTDGLAAKARLLRHHAAQDVADRVMEHFTDGGAIAIALAQSLLRDLQAA